MASFSPGGRVVARAAGLAGRPAEAVVVEAPCGAVNADARPRRPLPQLAARRLHHAEGFEAWRQRRDQLQQLIRGHEADAVVVLAAAPDMEMAQSLRRAADEDPEDNYVTTEESVQCVWSFLSGPPSHTRLAFSSQGPETTSRKLRTHCITENRGAVVGPTRICGSSSPTSSGATAPALSTASARSRPALQWPSVRRRLAHDGSDART